MFDQGYQFRQEVWEEYQEELAEVENETILNALNKLHNRKGYLLADYKNNSEEY